VNDDAFPPDPDLDDLPAELREREGPFTVSAVDPDTGELFDAPVTRDEVLRRRLAAGRLAPRVVLQAASAACETLARNRGREESHVSW
jgi:hypothetical protein